MPPAGRALAGGARDGRRPARTLAARDDAGGERDQDEASAIRSLDGRGSGYAVSREAG